MREREREREGERERGRGGDAVRDQKRKMHDNSGCEERVSDDEQK